MANRAEILIVTAVWGDWHIRQLLAVNLPTLLAPRNLPALAGRHATRYAIYTRAADVAQLSASPGVARLRTMMDVEFRLLAPGLLGDPIAAHHHAWDRARAAVEARGGLILYLPPDVAWSDGSFERLAGLVSEGRRAVFMTYLRAESVSFTTLLRRRAAPDEETIAIGARELVGMALRCLHPLMAASLVDSPHLPKHPEMLLWPVDEEGLVVRMLAREMFLFDPRRFRLNDTRLIADEVDPAEIHVVADSDELFAVSLAERHKDIDWYLPARRADPVAIGRWWLAYDSPANDPIASRKLRWHAGPMTEARWRAEELASDRFVRRCAVAREGLRVRALAQELGCGRAAQLIAFALYQGMLLRAMRGRLPATVFLPSNRAVGSMPPGWVEGLLRPEGARRFARLLRAHCATGRVVPPGGVCHRPTIRRGLLDVYVIDRVLD